MNFNWAAGLTPGAAGPLTEDSGKPVVTMKHNKGCARGLLAFNRSTGGEPNPEPGNRSNRRRLPGEGGQDEQAK